MPSRYLIFHLGARLHYAAALQLEAANILECLFTDTYAGEGSVLKQFARFIPERWRRGRLKRLLSRKAALPRNRVVAFNTFGLDYARALASRPASDVYWDYNRRFAEKITRHRRFAQADAVYGFCGASADLFRYAKAAGKVCILEQMIAPVAAMVSELRTQEGSWPGWAKVASDAWDVDQWSALEREEWALADLVLAPSEYVRSCLLAVGVPPSRIRMVPYGVALPLEHRVHALQPDRPLRLLAAGAVDLRKGAPNLITALGLFSGQEAVLRMAGGIGLLPERCARLPANVELLGQVPRTDMGKLYDWCDVFILPSVCEGSATVTYEALARGVPVVVSRNSGAPITPGQEGIVLDDLSPQTIAKVIRGLIAEPEQVARMSRCALARRDELSVESYGRRLIAAITSGSGSMLPKM